MLVLPNKISIFSHGGKVLDLDTHGSHSAEEGTDIGYGFA